MISSSVPTAAAAAQGNNSRTNDGGGVGVGLQVFQYKEQHPFVYGAVQSMRQLGIVLVTVAVFTVYMRTLSPNVAGGDSGELLAEGCILGTAHPPGYPLFTMMVYALHDGIAVKSLPSLNTAYLVNISSALLTALAAYCMGKVMIDFYKSSLAAAVFAMGMFSFSPLIWQYAVTAEVFPINTFFAAYIVYLVCSFAASKKSINLAIYGAFICGLGLTNQHTLILFEAPLILWMMYL